MSYLNDIFQRPVYLCTLCFFVLFNLFACGGIEEQESLIEPRSATTLSVTVPGSETDSLETDAVENEASAVESTSQETSSPECDLQFVRFQDVFQSVFADCSGCHRTAGLAGHSSFIIPETGNDLLWMQFQSVQEYLAGIGHAERMLSKPLGLGHGGGLQLRETDAGFLELQQFVANSNIGECSRAQSQEGSDTIAVSDLPMMQGVVLDYGDVLRRSAVLFGRPLPTALAMEEANELSEAAFKSRLKQEMVGPGFSDFVMTAANDQLLTNKWLHTDLLGFFQQRDFAAGFQWIEQIRQTEGSQAASQTRWQVRLGIAQAPLRLFEYIAVQDRPYTDILTADFTMVNHWSDRFLQTGAFSETEIEAGMAAGIVDSLFRPGRITGYKIQDLPESGILTMASYLARYPSTSTNRNRARAKWTHLFFLGEDIEALADRPMESEALSDTDNPTFNNISCTQCHETLDPMAGTFQNWSDNGFYRRYNVHSLPRSYTQSEAFQAGDLWYRDMREPGFNQVSMPEGERNSSVAWLAQQMINDDRFAEGAVRFWMPAFLGRALTLRPVTSNADNTVQVLTYGAELEVIQQIAATFRSSDGKSPWRLKDLFVELLMSPLLSHSIAPDTFEGDDIISQVTTAFGMGRMLRPEELHRKIEQVTGFAWKKSWQATGELHDRYLTLAGGIDSDGITKRIEEINTIASQVSSRMAIEMSCYVVSESFQQSAQERLLLSRVSMTDAAADEASEARVRSEIVELISRFWGVNITDPQDQEVTALYNLFRSVIASRLEREAVPWLANSTETCYLDWDDESTVSHDEFHTMRAWSAVLVYLMTDILFLVDR